MKDFMLLIKGDGRNSSPNDLQRKLREYSKWMSKYIKSGNYIDGSPFDSTGFYISKKGRIHEKGKWLKSNSIIGGYIHLKAKTIDEALEITADCPLLRDCGIYLRPFLKVNN